MARCWTAVLVTAVFAPVRNPSYRADMTVNLPNDDSDRPSTLEPRNQPDISLDAVRRLAEAVTHLSNDHEYFLEALTEKLLATRPVARGGYEDTARQYLIDSGVFTAESWAKTAASLERGSLQVSETAEWLGDLFATKSIASASVFLEWTEDAVLDAVAAGRLYAVEVSGRLRLPTWQFDIGSPNNLVPGLTEIIRVVAPRWSWQSVAGFMSTRQSSLVAEGRKTPVDWLCDGGDVAAVKQIVEDSDWS